MACGKITVPFGTNGNISLKNHWFAYDATISSNYRFKTAMAATVPNTTSNMSMKLNATDQLYWIQVGTDMDMGDIDPKDSVSITSPFSETVTMGYAGENNQVNESNHSYIRIEANPGVDSNGNREFDGWYTGPDATGLISYSNPYNVYPSNTDIFPVAGNITIYGCFSTGGGGD